MSEPRTSSGMGTAASRLYSLWNSATAALVPNSNHANPSFSLPKPDLPKLSASEQSPPPPKAHIDDVVVVLPSGKYKKASSSSSSSSYPSSSLSWTDGDDRPEEINTVVLTKGNHELAEVVHLTFDSVDSSSSSSSSPSSSYPYPPLPPPPPLVSPLVASLDTGNPCPPSILDNTDERDLDYVTRLQAEEVQKIREDLRDEEMVMMKQLEVAVSTATETARGSLHPKPDKTGIISSIVATRRPTSWPPAMPSSTKKKNIMTPALDLMLECECTACFDLFQPLTGLHASCGHHYCLPCVHNMVTACVSDESLFPPKCCNQPLMPVLAGKDNDNDKNEDEGCKQIKLLGFILEDKALKEKMENRWQEWSVKREERVYCSNSSCVIFLGSATELSAGDKSHTGSKESGSSSFIACCTACSASTCVSCRQSAHAGQTCADSGEALFWDMVKEKRWRQCSTCLVVIEKNGGCNIMKCPCGNKFTYEIE